MNANKILRFATIFYSLAKQEQLPDNSKNLDTILSNLESLETFAARKKYAENNLKRLSSGSARLVYLTPQKTVVKLAKNDRGIAQNKAECNPKLASKFFNKASDYASNFAWIETAFLNKITEKDFEDLTDIAFKDFGKAISYALKDISGNSNKEKPKNFTEISKSPIFKEIKSVAEKCKLMPGDLARISSYGEKDNHPVIIDAGLTKDIYNDFYESTSSS